MQACSPETKVRVSLGSLAVLGLADLRQQVPPSTLYLLQYSDSGCMAGCGFCSQSRRAPPGLRENLSRIRWPVRELGEIIDALRRGASFSRICLQSILKAGFLDELICMTRVLSSATRIPVSVASTPVGRAALRVLRDAGAERLGVGLDIATPRLIRVIGKPYPWSVYIDFIKWGVEIFGAGMVHVHLVAGLGEEPREMLEAMKLIYRLGARVALFRYTPLPGLPRYPGVGLRLYRFYQVARMLLEKGYEPLDYAVLEPQPRFTRSLPLRWEEIAASLLTSGCPGCNRPFYNERVRGPIYNYPSPKLLAADTSWQRDLEEIGATPRR